MFGVQLAKKMRAMVEEREKKDAEATERMDRGREEGRVEMERAVKIRAEECDRVATAQSEEVELRVERVEAVAEEGRAAAQVRGEMFLLG